jgi:hypothetical protein
MGMKKLGSRHESALTEDIMCARSLNVLLFLQFLTATFAVCGLPLPASSQSYIAVLLDPPSGFATSVANDIGRLSQVGMASNNTTTTTDAHALLWFGSRTGYVDLNPTGVTNAAAYGVWDNYQVGSGAPINSPGHALLWAGTAASVVDLHPAGFTSSVAHDISGSGQVGTAGLSGRTYAMLWHSTAASAMNLHSAPFLDTYAVAISDASQVGSGTLNTAGFPTHALLWRGTADSVVDLNPVGFASSAARDVSGDVQVGDGKLFGGGFDTHALLWHGTADSVIDLNPPGSSSSTAWSVEGNTQVGGGDRGALLWHGTAASVVYLQDFLTNLPVTIVRSNALGVNSRGEVVGVGFDANGAAHSLMWIAVPEPTTAVILAGMLTSISCGRPRRHNLRRNSC